MVYIMPSISHIQGSVDPAKLMSIYAGVQVMT